MFKTLKHFFVRMHYAFEKIVFEKLEKWHIALIAYDILKFDNGTRGR